MAEEIIDGTGSGNKAKVKDNRIKISTISVMLFMQNLLIFGAL